jgi:glycosyltransferase involved in cell wall biosynthesis
MAMDERLHDEKAVISVVMCAYNGMPYIKEAVACMLAQTYPAWELIISDDCSTDGTRQWLQEIRDPRIKIFLQEKNIGYVANKNFAHQQAKGEYITQLDNDDTCTPDRLEKQMNALLENPGIRIVGCGYIRLDENGTELARHVPERNIVLTEKTEDTYPFWFPSLLMHYSVFESVGGFDPYFAGVYGDDIYWTVKANEKYPILCIREPLYGYRYSATSITNVLNNDRKLIMAEVLKELLSQRKASGTDWLEKKDYASVAHFEQKLLNDHKYVGEQYRLWAAKAIDKNNLKYAFTLLKKSASMHLFNKNLLKTFRYFLSRKISF